MKHESETTKVQPFVGVFFNIMGAIRQPLLVLDNSLRVLKANFTFYQMFNLSPEETEGQLIYDLGNKQWDIPQIRVLLEDILTENSEFHDFKIEHDFASLGQRVLRLNAQRIERRSGKISLILLSIEDVTERENHERTLEDLVSKRTADLVATQQESENRRQTTEAALAKILMLKEQLEAERTYLQEEIKLVNNHERIIGQSDALKHVLYKVGQIASSNTTVLILGETGTGKELIARAVHAMSLRKNRSLVKVNCATLPTSLIESELFGHEKGSFTGSVAKHLGRFEIADGATLFLDEIGELPLELQAKLLRVLQDGEFERLGSSRTIKVDVRIIAATNRNLAEEVQRGAFREDLWYRLNIFPITVPPLRERPEDIPLLVDFFVKQIAKKLGKNISAITEGVMASLQAYHWPGNIRELENVLERAVINSSGPKLCLADNLQESVKETPANCLKTLETVEREYILQVLEQTNWKISGKDSASEILGLDRSTLRARMSKLRIEKS